MSLQCSFVNTEEKPVKIKRMGLFEYREVEGKFDLFEWCQIFYRHPDAPDHAIVSIYRPIEVEYPKGSEELIKQSVKGMKGIKAITNLTYYKELVV